MLTWMHLGNQMWLQDPYLILRRLHLCSVSLDASFSLTSSPTKGIISLVRVYPDYTATHVHPPTPTHTRSTHTCSPPSINTTHSYEHTVALSYSGWPPLRSGPPQTAHSRIISPPWTEYCSHTWYPMEISNQIYKDSYTEYHDLSFNAV